MLIDKKIYGHLSTDTNKLRVNVTGVGEFTMDALMLLHKEYLALSTFEYIKENEYFSGKTDDELLDIARRIRTYMEENDCSEGRAYLCIRDELTAGNEEEEYNR